MDIRLDSGAMTRILVVEDNLSMREAIAMIVESESDLSVCGEAQCISEAVEQCEKLHPDLALIDLSLKGEDGLDLIKLFRESTPSMSSVVFSLHDEVCYINGAREAGARGYAIKSAGLSKLLACMRSVRDGKSCFPCPG
jgi:DNA-binding NarL/FixJ family response regulator